MFRPLSELKRQTRIWPLCDCVLWAVHFHYEWNRGWSWWCGGGRCHLTGSRFKSQVGPFCVGLAVYLFNAYSGFILQFKNMHSQLTADTALTRGVSVGRNGRFKREPHWDRLQSSFFPLSPWEKNASMVPILGVKRCFFEAAGCAYNVEYIILWVWFWKGKQIQSCLYLLARRTLTLIAAQNKQEMWRLHF